MKLVQKLDYNAKVSKLENELPCIGGLVTTSA